MRLVPIRDRKRAILLFFFMNLFGSAWCFNSIDRNRWEKGTWEIITNNVYKRWDGACTLCCITMQSDDDLYILNTKQDNYYYYNHRNTFPNTESVI
jgi:hypothetical protein